MRLTPAQQQHIREAVREIFGESARVYLFGSRVDNDKRGGDIDLYLEVDDTSDWFRRKIRLAVVLQQRLGEQKIDLLLHRQGKPLQPMHHIAIETGVLL